MILAERHGAREYKFTAKDFFGAVSGRSTPINEAPTSMQQRMLRDFEDTGFDEFLV